MNLETTMNYLFLGALLGAVGQGLRIVIGLKKQLDAASMRLNRSNEPIGSSSNDKWESWFDTKQLTISIIISLIVGSVAGVLGVFNLMGKEVGRDALYSLIGIGYAGTDFIEGFIKSKKPVSIEGGQIESKAPRNDDYGNHSRGTSQIHV